MPPLLPQAVPAAWKKSVLHEEELPEHVSAKSHELEAAARHVVPADSNCPPEVQHGSPEEHTHPLLNLQVALSQQLSVTPTPGSQSSLPSTTPSPHLATSHVRAPGSFSRHRELPS